MGREASDGIEACVFDAYGTLFDLTSAIAAERARIGPEADRLSELWRRKQLEYTWLRSLMRAHLDFSAVTADALDQALATLRLDDSALRDRLLQAFWTLDAYPEVGESLAALRERGLRLAILSNGTPAMLAAVVAHNRLEGCLKAVLSVETAGVFKPDPAVYALATRALGLPARKIAFLSSNSWDAHGAAWFGFHAIWVNRAAAVPDRLPGTLAAEIRTLEPLAALLAP